MRRVRQRGLKPFTVGLIAIGLSIAATYLVATKELPFTNHFEIQAAFENANGLHSRTPVRMAGVEIGMVQKVEPYGDRAALVTMRIDDRQVRIRRDAQIKIRPRLLLEGNFFVDVKPGTPNSPALTEEDVVPVQQTAAPVQLDQVLTALDKDTRKQTGTTLDELGKALRRGGAAANRTFRYTEPAYRDSALVADAQLGLRPRDLSSYVRDGGKVAAALDRDPEALKSLITNFYITARGFAREDRNLELALDELPRTLRAGLPALAALNRAFPSVRTLITDLRPALRSSPPALDAGLGLTRELRHLVSPPELQGLTAQLRKATPLLARLNRSTVPFGEELRLQSSCQNEVLIPWGREKVPDSQFPAQAPVFAEGAKAFTGLAGESRSGDANGQWFRVFANAGNLTYQLDEGEFFQTAAPLLGVNPPPPDARPPLRADVPCETQQQPDLRTNPLPAPEPVATSLSSPEARERADRAKDVAVDWLRDRVDYQGLGGKLDVRSTDLSPAELERLSGR